MALKIDSDVRRFKKIVRGKIKKNLTKYLVNDEIIGKKGDHIIKVPVPRITIPRFDYDLRQLGGIGEGDGQIGDILSKDPSDGGKEAGTGDDGNMEVELFVDELTRILWEELELPDLEAKGNRTVLDQKSVYRKIARTGVRKDMKRTLKEGLRRQVSSGHYSPGDAIIPERRDFRYRFPEPDPDKMTSAVIIYMLDVSGSINEEQRKLFRTTNSWLQRIINRKYRNLEERFIIHTDRAEEVEEDFFYGTKREGGTKIFSAFKLCQEIIDKDYDPSQWNIYPIYYSDGDDSQREEGNIKALNILEQWLLPSISTFCYAQCDKGREKFLERMTHRFNLESNIGSEIVRRKIRGSYLRGEEEMLLTLKTFLNKDKVPFYLI